MYSKIKCNHSLWLQFGPNIFGSSHLLHKLPVKPSSHTHWPSPSTPSEHWNIYRLADNQNIILIPHMCLQALFITLILLIDLLIFRKYFWFVPKCIYVIKTITAKILLLKNTRLRIFLNHIYPKEFEIKDTNYEVNLISWPTFRDWCKGKTHNPTLRWLHIPYHQFP